MVDSLCAIQEELFTTSGTLRVRLTEGIDLLDGIIPPEETNLKQKKKLGSLKYWVYASISIFDNESVVTRSDSSLHPFLTVGSGKVNFDEEFLFDVSSSNTAVIAVFAIDASTTFTTMDGESCPQCAGTQRVPVSRLESGVSVCQWYQMYSLASREGLRCAIKIDVSYRMTNLWRSVDVVNHSFYMKARERHMERSMPLPRKCHQSCNRFRFLNHLSAYMIVNKELKVSTFSFTNWQQMNRPLWMLWRN